MPSTVQFPDLILSIQKHVKASIYFSYNIHYTWMAINFAMTLNLPHAHDVQYNALAVIAFVT